MKLTKRQKNIIKSSKKGNIYSFLAIDDDFEIPCYYYSDDDDLEPIYEILEMKFKDENKDKLYWDNGELLFNDITELKIWNQIITDKNKLMQKPSQKGTV